MRGSTPCPAATNARYGGNTSCVSVDAPGRDTPLVLDAGTGLRTLGEHLAGPFVGDLFVTHLHFDHIQGLPFFTPLLRSGADVRIWGPAQHEGTLEKALNLLISPPFFPVSIGDLAGRFEFSELADDRVEIEGGVVESAFVPHCGPTLGFRIEAAGRTIAFLPDHQQPQRWAPVAASALRLADGADLLVHDAQYTRDEFVARHDWGHSTIEYAVSVAIAAGVRRLALFSHDPAHTDDMIDTMVERARRCPDAGRLEIFAAAEGLTVEV